MRFASYCWAAAFLGFQAPMVLGQTPPGERRPNEFSFPQNHQHMIEKFGENRVAVLEIVVEGYGAEDSQRLRAAMGTPQVEDLTTQEGKRRFFERQRKVKELEWAGRYWYSWLLDRCRHAVRQRDPVHYVQGMSSEAKRTVLTASLL